MIAAVMRQFSLCSALVCAVVLGVCPIHVAAQEESRAPSKPIAIIGSSVISETEIDRIESGRPQAYAELPSDERRARIIDTLVAEYLIDYHYGRDTRKLSPEVSGALNDARRQVLLQFFIQSQFTPPEITEAAVADFIARNPALFGDRRSYDFVVVTLSGGTLDARQAVLDRIQDIFALPEIEIAALDKMISESQGNGVTATLNTVWQPSEALDNDVLSRLLSMVRDNRRIDITNQLDEASILLLNSSVSIPADPAKLRDQIEQRLISEAFEVHSEKLVHRMALTVLDPSAARAEDKKLGADLTVAPPPRGSVVWSSRPGLPDSIRLAALFGVGIFGTWASYLLWAWLRLVLAQYEHILKSRLETPFLSQRITGIVVTAFAALALLIGSGKAVTIAMQSLGKIATGVTLAGSVTTAIAMAAIWHFLSRRAFNRAAEKQTEKYGDISTARQMLLRRRKPVKNLAAAAAIFALFGISLAMLLDGPTGLS